MLVIIETTTYQSGLSIKEDNYKITCKNFTKSPYMPGTVVAVKGIQCDLCAAARFIENCDYIILRHHQRVMDIFNNPSLLGSTSVVINTLFKNISVTGKVSFFRCFNPISDNL